MSVTQRTIDEAKVLEGLPGGRPALMPYQDIAGVWTDGFGNTHGVIPGRQISAAEAETTLAVHLATADAAIDRVLGAQCAATLNDNQRGALQLFVLNVGAGAFGSSTLARALKAGEFDKVPDQLMRWCRYRNPKTNQIEVAPGLQNRRAAEVRLWLEPTHGNTNDDPVVPSATMPQSVVRPEPPPAPANVLQTSTGKAMAGTLATGAAAAMSQAQPVIETARSLGGVNMSNLLSLLGLLFIAACVGFTAWTLWDRHRKLRADGQ